MGIGNIGVGRIWE